MIVLENDTLDISSGDSITFLTLDENFPNTKWSSIKWESGSTPCHVVFDAPMNVVAVDGAFNLVGKEVSFV